jgi:hypothetical protein
MRATGAALGRWLVDAGSRSRERRFPHVARPSSARLTQTPRAEMKKAAALRVLSPSSVCTAGQRGAGGRRLTLVPTCLETGPTSVLWATQSRIVFSEGLNSRTSFSTVRLARCSATIARARGPARPTERGK